MDERLPVFPFAVRRDIGWITQPGSIGNRIGSQVTRADGAVSLTAKIRQVRGPQRPQLSNGMSDMRAGVGR